MGLGKIDRLVAYTEVRALMQARRFNERACLEEEQGSDVMKA